MSHHANDGSASRALRGLLKQHGYNNDISGPLAAAAAQDARCAQGEHDEAEARPRYVTYVQGRQVSPGTRYCRRCWAILPGERPSGPAADRVIVDEPWPAAPVLGQGGTK